MTTTNTATWTDRAMAACEEVVQDQLKKQMLWVTECDRLAGLPGGQDTKEWRKAFSYQCAYSARRALAQELQHRLCRRTQRHAENKAMEAHWAAKRAAKATLVAA